MSDEEVYETLGEIQTDIASMKVDIVWMGRVIGALTVVVFGVQLI